MGRADSHTATGNIVVPAFRAIVAQEGTFIRRVLHSLGVCASDMDDVEQEVLFGVHRGLSTFDPSLSSEPERAIRAWLCGICERQAASCRRKSARRSEILTDSEDLDEQQSDRLHPEERWLLQERQARIHELLSRIPHERRAVLVAYDLEGMPMKEVALALNIRVNTAWNRRRLGLLDLRDEWLRRTASESRREDRPSESSDPPRKG